MENRKTSPKYSSEERERAVRMVFDYADEYPSQWAAIGSIAHKIGCASQTLHNWVGQAAQAILDADQTGWQFHRPPRDPVGSPVNSFSWPVCRPPPSGPLASSGRGSK